MLDEYVEGLNNACPADVAGGLTMVDFGATRDFDLSSELVRRAATHADCFTAFVRYLAAKYVQDRPRGIETRLLAYMAQVPAERRDEVAPEVIRVLNAMDLPQGHARNYFRASLAYGIDQRSRFDPQFPGGSISDARSDALYYYIYLADLGDPRGLHEIDTVTQLSEPDADRLTGFLLQMADMERADATVIYRRYLADQRATTGVNGPGSGPTVALAAQRGLNILQSR